MALKGFTGMGTCAYCGEWTNVFRYKNSYWCQDDIDLDKAKSISKQLNNTRNSYIREFRRAIK